MVAGKIFAWLHSGKTAPQPRCRSDYGDGAINQLMAIIKPTIYIETTIPNFFFDFKNQSPEKKVETVYCWNNNLTNFETLTSLATIRELEVVSNKDWQASLLKLVENFKIIDLNKKVLVLAQNYVSNNLIPQKYSADALHLAISTIAKIDYLLTWNIQHLAHPIKRKMFREYNFNKNLYVTEIVTPKELNFKLNP